MKKGIILFTLIVLLTDIITAQENRPVDLVNPFIDTGAPRTRWFFFNSACRPFGMVNLSPDTNPYGDWGYGYRYDDEYIRCISHVHAWEMGGAAVMPTVGKFLGAQGMEAYKSKFSHEGEIAKPGYHKFFLDNYNIQVELSSTTRVGFHKYTFPESDQSYILFDTGAQSGHAKKVYSEIWQVSDTVIAGYEIMERTMRRPKDFPVYFYISLSKPANGFVSWHDSTVVTNSDPVRISGSNSGIAVKYSTKKNEEILMKVAISYVSVGQAKLNLETELAHWDFEKVKQESFEDWNNWLSRIETEGGTHEQQVKFYTDLWHSLLGRRIVSDVDGKYMDLTGAYPRIRQVRLDENKQPVFPHFNFDAWWGTQWSLNILWSVVYPEITDAFCNTMVDIYKNGGLIPRGSTAGNYSYVMIGDPAASFFATAYNKGIRNYDTEVAYEGLRKNAFPGGIRSRAGYEHRFNASSGGISYYIDRGYVPYGRPNLKGAHATECVSMTLEYAYQDWCLAQMALKMGKAEDYDYFMKRSQNYKNLWNPEESYFVPRNMNGNWMKDFNPLSLEGFCESNSAIYSHFVPHDMTGLIELYGGYRKYIKRLDEQFQRAEPYGFFMSSKQRHDIETATWIDYGNQPGTGLAHLFNYARAPWLTQYWVRKVKEEYCNITPYGGYKGDEDQGQMGALGVLMAIGLFEVDGGVSVNPVYEITSPVFDKITLHLNEEYYPGKTFVIATENNSPDNIYIQKTELNGKKWNKFYFPHDVLINGGQLNISLGSKPNRKWGLEK